MEAKNGIVRITRKEMQELKKMDHRQIEGKLQEAYEAGREEEYTAWQEAVRQTLAETKGIGEKRKEILTLSMQLKLKRVN